MHAWLLARCVQSLSRSTCLPTPLPARCVICLLANPGANAISVACLRMSELKKRVRIELEWETTKGARIPRLTSATLTPVFEAIPCQRRDSLG